MAEGPVLVVDMGSSSTKIGMACEDSPASVFPTHSGQYPRTIEVLLIIELGICIRDLIMIHSLQFN
jgi:actin-related protein